MIAGKDALERMQALVLEMRSEERGVSLDDIKRLKGVRLPRWSSRAVRETLRGYHDRERSIKDGTAKADVLAEYLRINRAIDDAVSCVCFGYGESVVKTLREDLIQGRGWQFSTVSGIFSERTFYKLKDRCYLYVAARMSWI